MTDDTQRKYYLIGIDDSDEDASDWIDVGRYVAEESNFDLHGGKTVRDRELFDRMVQAAIDVWVDEYGEPPDLELPRDSEQDHEGGVQNDE